MSARTGSPAILSAAARTAAAEATFLRLVGLLFERPRAGWHEELRSLAANVDHPAIVDAVASGGAASEGDYLRLFGPGGLVSPREVAYRGLADPALVLSDIRALYGAFGFHPRAEDPDDHIAVEVGFAGYLAIKEAYALSRRARGAARRAREARDLLLASHLRPFVTGLAGRLRRAAPPGYLDAAARILADWAGCDPSEECAEEAQSSESTEDALPACGGCGGATRAEAPPLFVPPARSHR